MEIQRKKGIKKITINHNKKLLWIIGILFVFFIIVIYLNVKINRAEKEKQGNYECNIDSDCVHSACCHPDSCVAIENAPDCSTAFCSQVCSGPLDCGAGYCGCINNKCEIISNEG